MFVKSGNIFIDSWFLIYKFFSLWWIEYSLNLLCLIKISLCGCLNIIWWYSLFLMLLFVLVIRMVLWFRLWVSNFLLGGIGVCFRRFFILSFWKLWIVIFFEVRLISLGSVCICMGSLCSFVIMVFCWVCLSDGIVSRIFVMFMWLIVFVILLWLMMFKLLMVWLILVGLLLMKLSSINLCVMFKVDVVWAFVWFVL